MSRYFIKLAYNGTKYNGWQIQENTPNTIQQIFQEKLMMLLQESIEVSGCGRTDTGVHGYSNGPLIDPGQKRATGVARFLQLSRLHRQVLFVAEYIRLP